MEKGLRCPEQQDGGGKKEDTLNQFSALTVMSDPPLGSILCFPGKVSLGLLGQKPEWFLH